ncbi:MAG: serine hydrolase [Bacteroidales bacterium]|nr:serine hydrolase [Bacteroidales bacterium]
MKKSYIILAVLVILVVGLSFGFKYLLDRAPIFTGYAAKEVASQLFVNNRDFESVKQNDINFSLIPLSSITVDTLNKEVTTNFLGFAKQKAVYRDGLGCALIADGNEDFAKSIYSNVPILPSNPQDVFWPMGEKLRDTIMPSVDIDELQQVIDSFSSVGKTRAIVVAIDTLMMLESYANGFDKDTRILGWSMTKSITNAFIGILVKQGLLDINSPAPIGEWANDNRKNITLRHLLTMTSGLKWVEDYGDISEATIMLYQKGDVGNYAISTPLAFPPDSVWYYSSGTSNILSLIIRRTINNDQLYWDFPRNQLFNRIGMRSAIIETDASGTFVGSSYIQAVPRDYARFGLLFLQNGIWQNDTILPSGWVDFSRSEAPKSNGEYGAQFWLNLSGSELPDCPKDIYFCDGFNGQRIYIIPSKRMVIVRMGLSKSGEFDYNQMVKSILETVH